MTSPALSVGPLADDQELSDLLDVIADAFNVPPDDGRDFAKRIGFENYRAVRADGTVIGGLAVIDMGQFFGGRSVPMTGISVVGVAPEHRACGAANTAMCETMREIAARGIPLSCLYPATQTLYRRSGFEQAGSRWAVSLDLKSMSRPKSSLTVRRVTDDDHDTLRTLYQQRAVMCDGNLDRNEYMWYRIHVQRKRPSIGYLIERDGHAEGYVMYVRDETQPWGYNLTIRDLVALTPDAGRRILRLLADHRSMSHKATWFSAPNDPLLNLLDEQPYEITLDIHWMLRLTDVVGALTARGYATGVTAEAEIEVVDDVIPANSDRFTIRIAGGSCSVDRGGSGRTQFDVRGLAQLYSGFRTVGQLHAAGAVTGDIDAARGLDAAFVGGSPWMPDMF